MARRALSPARMHHLRWHQSAAFECARRSERCRRSAPTQWPFRSSATLPRLAPENVGEAGGPRHSRAHVCEKSRDDLVVPAHAMRCSGRRCRIRSNGCKDFKRNRLPWLLAYGVIAIIFGRRRELPATSAIDLGATDAKVLRAPRSAHMNSH